MRNGRRFARQARQPTGEGRHGIPLQQNVDALGFSGCPDKSIAAEAAPALAAPLPGASCLPAEVALVRLGPDFGECRVHIEAGDAEADAAAAGGAAVVAPAGCADCASPDAY
jgi:hypothetical protein